MIFGTLGEARRELDSGNDGDGEDDDDGRGGAAPAGRPGAALGVGVGAVGGGADAAQRVAGLDWDSGRQQRCGNSCDPQRAMRPSCSPLCSRLCAEGTKAFIFARSASVPCDASAHGCDTARQTATCSRPERSQVESRLSPW